LNGLLLAAIIMLIGLVLGEVMIRVRKDWLDPAPIICYWGALLIALLTLIWRGV